jgi:hypothetical protein
MLLNINFKQKLKLKSISKEQKFEIVLKVGTQSARGFVFVLFSEPCEIENKCGQKNFEE